MKRRLNVVAVMMVLNSVLTPFSYAFDDGVSFVNNEEAVVENEINDEDQEEL
jgi:hypothetical protein